MSNVEKFNQMRIEAADALFEEDNEEKSDYLFEMADSFAEQNFTEADFDEWINTLHGHMKADMIQWKNEVLKKRTTKAIAIKETKKQLSF